MPAYGEQMPAEGGLQPPPDEPSQLEPQPVAGFLPPAEGWPVDDGGAPPPPDLQYPTGIRDETGEQAPQFDLELPEPTPAGGEIPPQGASDGLDADIAALFGGEAAASGEMATPPQQPEELQISCHNCGEIMEVTVTERPVTIQCWNCNAEGMIE